MNNLVYLAYGQGPHNDELIYSVLSALYMSSGKASDYRIIVYTDNPTAFGDLPVHIEVLSDEVLADWAGPFEYNHRRKICCVRDALEKRGGRVIFCDSDTYFLNHPRKLFARVRPGHALMHIREGHPEICHALELADFLDDHDLRDIGGHRWNITRYNPVFNSGVIGLHEAEVSVLDEVVYLMDQIYPRIRYFATEQFALGVCFRHYTRLRESYDIVYHYWPMPRRGLFQEQLRRVLHDPGITSNEERYHRLLPYRPAQSQKVQNRVSESLRHRAYIALREVAKRMGMLDPIKKIFRKAGMT